MEPMGRSMKNEAHSMSGGSFLRLFVSQAFGFWGRISICESLLRTWSHVFPSFWSFLDIYGP